MSSSVELVLKLAAEAENTPELTKFWQKKYLEIYTRNLFALSDKTLELALSEQTQTRPATTYGNLVLKTHLTSGNHLDEELLQNTIETAVRLLDALLDKINFSETARTLVNQYRKIAIGLGDWEEFVNHLKPANETDLINYVGQLVSHKTYRASESLAEEKGPCLAWDKLKQQLRPKPFEFWYDKTTGDLKNGEELAKILTPETIAQSSFELIPRRNSALLLFPQAEAWLRWGDREPYWQPNSTVEVIIPSQSSNTTDDQSVLNPPEPAFQVGELVQVSINDQPQILQVIEVITNSDKETNYKLTDGSHTSEQQLWPESALQPIELTDLLPKLNQSNLYQSGALEIQFYALILNSAKQTVALDKDNTTLPKINLRTDQDLETNLKTFLHNQFAFEPDFTTIIVSSISWENHQPTLHLSGYVPGEDFPESPQLTWQTINHLSLPQYQQTLVSKTWAQLQQQLALTNQLSRANQLAASLSDQLAKQPTARDANIDIRIYKPKVVAVNLGSLSKYVLKLEQLLSSDKYGKLLLTITYDAKGPRLLSLKGSQLSPELQANLDLFLELVNFILINDIDPQFLSQKLTYSEYAQMNSPLKELLQFVGQALATAPRRIQEVNSDIVADIDLNHLPKTNNWNIL